MPYPPARTPAFEAVTLTKPPTLSGVSDWSALKNLGKVLAVFISRTEQVISQTCRRIFDQEKVSAQEKIVSLFENHTDIICRGKIDILVEFGHKVWRDEVDDLSNRSRVIRCVYQCDFT